MVPFKKWAEATVVVVDQLLALFAAGFHQVHVTCDAHFHPLSDTPDPNTRIKKYKNSQIGESNVKEIQKAKVLAPCNTWMAPISPLCLHYDGSSHRQEHRWRRSRFRMWYLFLIVSHTQSWRSGDIPRTEEDIYMMYKSNMWRHICTEEKTVYIHSCLRWPFSRNEIALSSCF